MRKCLGFEVSVHPLTEAHFCCIDMIDMVILPMNDLPMFDNTPTLQTEKTGQRFHNIWRTVTQK